MPTFSSFSKYPRETHTAADHWTCEFQWNQTLWKYVETSGKTCQRETLIFFLIYIYLFIVCNFFSPGAFLLKLSRPMWLKGPGLLFLIYVDLTSRQPWVLSKRERGYCQKRSSACIPTRLLTGLSGENKTHKCLAEGGFIEKGNGAQC